MAVDHNNPQSRNEEILIATIDGNEYNKAPQSRMEELLLELKETIEEGGGGGTGNYNDLSNQPQINGNTLVGNKTASDLGLVAAETGKGLSTNDYTDADKAIVGGVTAALADKVDKVEGKGLSTNDFTDAYKTAIGANTTAISGIKDGQSIDSFADVESALANKQDKTDNNLETTSKTVVGAVNELKSGLTDLTDHVDGDATTYPYGDVITINDAVPANLKDCIVKIEPVQSGTGTPSPDNVRPISGHTEAVVTREGVNIFNPNALETFDANGEGTIRTGHRFKEVKKYIVNNINNGNIFGRLVKTDLSEYGQYATILPNTYASFTVTEGYMLYVYYEAVSGMSAENICVKYGDDTTFIAYEGQQYTLALGDTIYGGTVDFETGVMTVDRAIAEYDGSEDESWNMWGQSSASAYAMVITVSADHLNNSAHGNESELISNQMEYVPIDETWGNYDVLLTYPANVDYTRIIAGLRTITTVADWRTYLSSHPLQVCYKVKTPFTVQLTPQQIQLLKGTNTLYASTGQISVTANGVSGAIGAVQEQVNELAEEVADIKPVNYSTTEQKTGQKWIDGKDIYIVVYQPSSPVAVANNEWTDIGMSSSGIGTILKITGIAVDGACCPMIAEKENGKIKCLASRDNGGFTTVEFIVKYTKTT